MTTDCWRRALRTFPSVGAIISLMAGCGIPPVFPLIRSVRTSTAYEIPTGPQARTQADADRDCLKFLLRNSVEVYRKVGVRDPKWDQDALSYLEAFSRLGVEPEAMPLSELVKRGEDLVNRGCADPSVLLAYGAGLQDSHRLRDAEPILQQALDGLVKQNYPRTRAWGAAARLAQIARKLGGEKDPEAARYLDLSLKYMGDALSDGSFQAGEQGVFLELLAVWWGSLYEGHEEQVYKAVQGNPKADEYIAKVVGGMYHIAAAWQARGEDWAPEVSEKGWEGFEKHLRSARLLLTEAWNLHPEFPQAPAEIITVVAADSSGEAGTERLWFNRAVSAQMDYEFAYDNLLWFLRPRWGGSHEEMYEFGLKCLGTARFDTIVPLRFAIAVREITDDLEGKTTYWRKSETWERLEAMFDGYAKAEKPPYPGAFFESVRAATAYQCGRHDEARQVLDKLGDQLDVPTFNYYAGVEPEAIRREVGAKETAAGKEPGSGQPRKGLYQFHVFTPEEDECIYSDDGTWKVPWPSEDARVADARQRIVYQFTIPREVPGAAFCIRIVNNFALGVAKDSDGEPGEFHEELNAVKWLGRLCFNAENDHEQVLDLTPYLADNPSRKVYVAIYSCYPEGGWGAIFNRAEVVALSGAEKKSVERLQRALNDFAARDRHRYPLNFGPDGGQKEANYIYKNVGSYIESGLRRLGGDSYIVYYLPLSKEHADCVALAWVQGDYVVSFAPAAKGKPGKFQRVRRARDKYTGAVLEAFGNMDDVWQDITKETAASGGCYLKIADAAPDQAPDVIIRDISLRRP